MTKEREDHTAVVDVEVARRPKRHTSRGYLVVLSGKHVGEMFHVKGEIRVGRSPEADVTLMDSGISREHCVFSRDGGGDIYLQDLESTNGTFANGRRVESRKLSEGDQIQLGDEAVLKFTYHDEVELQFQKQMYDSAVRDGLTNTFNKRFFIDRLAAELAFAVRHEAPLTLTMLDLDHFKALNDTHGHLAGDRVLRAVAEDITRTIRREDVLCRYGGEEFAVLSRGIDVGRTQTMAERICQTVRDRVVHFEDTIIRVTVSAGVAGIASLAVQEPDALVAAADEALYRAKAAGRDCVRAHPPPT